MTKKFAFLKPSHAEDRATPLAECYLYSLSGGAWKQVAAGSMAALFGDRWHCGMPVELKARTPPGANPELRRALVNPDDGVTVLVLDGPANEPGARGYVFQARVCGSLSGHGDEFEIAPSEAPGWHHATVSAQGRITLEAFA